MTLMKMGGIWLLLFAMAISIVTSCSENDSNHLGTYTITSIQSVSCSDPAENLNFDFSGPGGCGIQQGVEICGDGRLTLSGRNTYTLFISIRIDKSALDVSSSGSFEIDGDQITVCEDEQCQTGTFDVDNGTITLTYPDESCVVTVRGEKRF